MDFYLIHLFSCFSTQSPFSAEKNNKLTLNLRNIYHFLNNEMTKNKCNFRKRFFELLHTTIDQKLLKMCKNSLGHCKSEQNGSKFTRTCSLPESLEVVEQPHLLWTDFSTQTSDLLQICQFWNTRRDKTTQNIKFYCLVYSVLAASK